MKETIMYCQELDRHDGGKFYTYFHLHPSITRMCDNELPILKVNIIEVREGEESDYWAWWSYENNDDKFIFCYHQKKILGMCFPYGMKIEEENGKGIGVNVMIEIIEVMKDV